MLLGITSALPINFLFHSVISWSQSLIRLLQKSIKIAPIAKPYSKIINSPIWHLSSRTSWRYHLKQSYKCSWFPKRVPKTLTLHTNKILTKQLLPNLILSPENPLNFLILKTNSRPTPINQFIFLPSWISLNSVLECYPFQSKSIKLIPWYHLQFSRSY